MTKYLTSFIETAGIDPFVSDCTLAGACMRTFRTNFLPAYAIGAYPIDGYRLARKTYSRKAIRWLRYLERTEVKNPDK
jgi:hypothetical protein